MSFVMLLSGDGELIEADDNVVAIGSGGGYALSAAHALLRYTDMSAAEIARAAMDIAASICIYTNDHITLESAGEVPRSIETKGGVHA